MKNNNQSASFYIKINYQNEEHELLVNFSSTVTQLRQIIFTYFKLNQAKYNIYYKNLKLNDNDTRTLSLLFEKDNKPLLLILDKKKDIMPKTKQISSLTLFTKMPQIKFNEIVTKFFDYKKLENNAEIKNNIKGMYIVSFPNASICADFQEFYDNYLRIEEENKVPSPKYKTATSEENRLMLPKINSNYCYNKNNRKKGDEKDKSISSYKYNPYDDRRKAINNVILNNSKTDLISEKYIRNGKYRMHNYDKNNNPKSIGAKNRNNYKGIYKSPYMNDEEKYYREKYLDKKNWLNKNGFLPSMNRKNSNDFIPNYVTATPSESPLLFRFRDVSKDKWINPKGFH